MAKKKGRRRGGKALAAYKTARKPQPPYDSRQDTTAAQTPEPANTGPLPCSA